MALTLVVSAGCGPLYSQPPQRPLRISMNPWPGYSLMYLAEERGYFEDEGLTVRLVEMASLADARSVFEQGRSDMICCSLVEVLLMNENPNRNSVKCVAALDYSNGADMILASDSVGSLAELRGRKIGVEPESIDGLTVFLALSSVGLCMEDVELVPLAQSEMLEAMRLGTVDAVPIYPPASDSIAKLPGVHRLWNSSQSPCAILDVLAARESLLVERADAIRAVNRAYHRAQQFYVTHPQEALAVLARRCRLSPEAMRQFMDGVKILNVETDETRQLFQQSRADEVTDQIAQGLIATGMLQQLPSAAPFDGRFLEPLTQ